MGNPRDTQAENHHRGRGRRLFWLAIALVGVVFIATTSEGSGRRRGHRHGGPDGTPVSRADIERAVDYLDIEGPQRSDVIDALEGIADVLETARVDQRRITVAARQLLAADTLNEAELEALRAEVADLARRASVDAFDGVVEAAGLLRAEQRRELIDAWEERR
jgi:hypothetical protein